MSAIVQRQTYSIADLERLTGVNSRTIRFYITRGLLPPAHGRGPSATYDQEHLDRLQVIKLLRDQHIPLAEIGTRLAELSPRQVASLIQPEAQTLGAPWRRIVLHPNIELHYQEPTGDAGDSVQEAIQRIVDLAAPIVKRLEERR